MKTVRIAGLASWLAASCAAAPPPAARQAPAPEAPPAIEPPSEERAPPRSLGALAELTPRTLAQVHLVHAAQLQEALRAPENDFDDGVLAPVWEGLGAAFAGAGPEDLALARELAEAAPEGTFALLDAMTTSGMPGERRTPTPALARALDAIVLDGPAAAKVWALTRGYGGSGGDARAFVREALERGEATRRCPPAEDEEVGAAVDRLFGARQGVPCLGDADRSPDELSRASAAELMALLEGGGALGRAAALALRTKIQGVDAGAPGALEALLSADAFGRLIELAGADAVDGSVVLQALTSAHGEPAWLDWLAAHPERVGPAQREMVALLLEADARPGAPARHAAALARLRAASGSLPAATRRFRLPDASPETLAAAWRLVPALEAIGPLSGVTTELMRRSAASPAARAAAARNEAAIDGALGRCGALVAARGGERWLDRALRDATAEACSGAARLAAEAWTPRLRRALVEIVRSGPDAWARAVYEAIALAGHEPELSPAALDGVLARPAPVRDLLLAQTGHSALWGRLAAGARTDDAVLALVARVTGAVLLGAWPDRARPGEEVTGLPDVQSARAFVVSADALPGLEARFVLAVLRRPASGLRPLDVARVAAAP